MRTCGIAVLILVVHTVVTVPASSQSTCQASRITGSAFNFAGSPSVTIPVGGYPSSFAVALEAGSAIWNDEETCPGKEKPEFKVDKGHAPPSSTTSSQMRLEFLPDTPAPFDDDDNVYEAAQVDHVAGIVKVYGKCPPDEGTRRFSFCNAKRTKIDWNSDLGIVTLAHELGHTLRLGHDACANSLMQLQSSTNGQILPAHCELVDELHAVVSVTATVTGISSTTPTQSGANPEDVIVSAHYAGSTATDVNFSEITVTQDGTIPLPDLRKAWSATFSGHSLNDNKSCEADPSNVNQPTGPVSVQITCTCQGSTSTDCPYDFPQDQSKFEPFLPLWQIFAEPEPWYLSSFGPSPFLEENPSECERQTTCVEGSQEVVTVGGETIVTQVLNCSDQCVAASTIDLHGPSTKLEFPGGDHAGDGNLTVAGYAVDAEGLYDLKFYVGTQPVALSGLQKNLYRPKACTEVQGANRINCSPNGGFQGTLDATSLGAGTHKLRVVALDSKSGYPMATLAEKPFTVPSCFDSTRPTVSLTSPANGSTVSGTVTVAASATDNVGVTRVDLFVDGVRKKIDTSAPYTYSWNTTTATNDLHTVQARAFDACGNVRWSAKHTVTVFNIVPCQENSTTLCFQNDRFAARVAINGQNGVAIPFTNSGGFFRLADPANVEVALKVLDGRSSNGRFWVFHGSLTTQPYTVTVTDTHTGRIRNYSNSGLCGGADTSSFVDSSWWYDLAISSGTCSPTTRSVCLQGDRFRVEVLKQGDPQRGVEVTSKTGSFGFASASDPEVVVKVLDGRAVNNRYWVFFGSLTNQSYAVRVTDTVTGIAKLYGSPGSFCGNADTSAF